MKNERKIGLLNKRDFSLNDAVKVKTSSGFLTIRTNVLKRHKLVVALLGKVGRTGIADSQGVANQLNIQLGKVYYNRNHTMHSLRQLANVGVVEYNKGLGVWRLTARGAAIFKTVKIVNRN